MEISFDSGKGFVYTLEAVIAASLMLGTVVFVIPEIQETGSPALDDLKSAIRALDDVEELGSNNSEIQSNLEPHTPSNYNLSILSKNVRTEDGTVDGSDEFFLDEGTKEVMLWIESASSLEITFRGNTVFDRDQTGYHRISLEDESGYLNFTGSSQLSFRTNYFWSGGQLPDTREAYSVNYIDHNGTIREIKGVIWR